VVQEPVVQKTTSSHPVSTCFMDRCGIYVVLTEEGRHRHAEAAVTHREVLTRLLAAR
jgi:DNA-binding MarR family transcriptional regulator